MLKKFSAMVKDEKGQALAEYGLILALIAVLCVTALGLLGGQIQATLGSITAAL
jgi:pilus assembly protein Flp/PilA